MLFSLKQMLPFELPFVRFRFLDFLLFANYKLTIENNKKIAKPLNDFQDSNTKKYPSDFVGLQVCFSSHNR